jgi:hypothetical protein
MKTKAYQTIGAHVKTEVAAEIRLRARDAGCSPSKFLGIIAVQKMRELPSLSNESVSAEIDSMAQKDLAAEESKTAAKSA